MTPLMLLLSPVINFRAARGKVNNRLKGDALGILCLCAKSISLC